MNLSQAAWGAVSAIVVVIVQGWFTNKKGNTDIGSAERVAILEHSGESIEKLNKMIDEKIELANKLTKAESTISKRDNTISELRRQLEVANKNIEDLLLEIKSLKEVK